MRHHSVRKWKNIMRFEIGYIFLEIGLSPKGLTLRYIFVTVYQFFTRSLRILRPRIYCNIICKYVKICKKVCKNEEIWLKICKSTSFLPEMSLCTSFLPYPPPPLPINVKFIYQWLNPISRKKYLISNLNIYFHFLTESWRTHSNVLA